MPPVVVAAAVIGRMSLPTLIGVVDWQSVWLAVVEVVDVDVEVEVEFVDEVDVEFVSPPASATGTPPAGVLLAEADWACAYAAIPPETITSIAATVRIWSFP